MRVASVLFIEGGTILVAVRQTFGGFARVFICGLCAAAAADAGLEAGWLSMRLGSSLLHFVVS